MENTNKSMSTTDAIDELGYIRDELRGLSGIAWSLADFADKNEVTPESLFVMHENLRRLADRTDAVAAGLESVRE